MTSLLRKEKEGEKGKFKDQKNKENIGIYSMV